MSVHTQYNSIGRSDPHTCIYQCRLAAHDPPLALKNTGVLSRQSLAGALATGTHGTGVAFPIMSEQVRVLLEAACLHT